jgi:hypothetical protein
MKAALTGLISLFLVGLGCGTSEDQTSGEMSCTASSTPLVIADASLWMPVNLDVDPFADQAEGDPVHCRPIHYGPEIESGVLWFGIDTRECGYLTLRQPLLETLCPGDTVELRLWHFALTDTPFGYQALLSIDGTDTHWRDEVAPPATAKTVEGQFTVDKRIETGTPIYFHLSNHGTNSWGLLDVTAHSLLSRQ